MSRINSRHQSPYMAALWVAAGAAAGVFVGMAIADRYGGGRAFMSVASRVLGALGRNGTLAGGGGTRDNDDEYDGEYDELDEQTEFDSDLDDEEDLLAAYAGEGVGDSDAGDDDDEGGADQGQDGHNGREGLDARVLRAYEHDPILAHRSIEIDEPEPSTIVLAGEVADADDVAHAETVARGVPGVARVENQLRVRPHAPARATPGT